MLSTIHSAKGLEWPVVHLLHLVDGAVPSDMALGSPEGLAEERRLFYVAVTRARDQLYLYAPLRMHHHRMSADDRHGYGQLTRFLTPAALAECETVDATPPQPVVPKIGPLAVDHRRGARLAVRAGLIRAGPGARAQMSAASQPLTTRPRK